jgi:hypothetical protein
MVWVTGGQVFEERGGMTKGGNPFFRDYALDAVFPCGLPVTLSVNCVKGIIARFFDSEPRAAAKHRLQSRAACVTSPPPKKITGAYWFRLKIRDADGMPRKPGWPRYQSWAKNINAKNEELALAA